MSCTIDLQPLLDTELQRIHAILPLSTSLTVRWHPDPQRQLAGEVRGTIIYIYDRDQKQALNTLRHEVVDYCISQAIKPYCDMTNHLIRLINADAYRRKETIVNAVTRFITPDSPSVPCTNRKGGEEI